MKQLKLKRPPGVEDDELWIDTVAGEKLVFPTYEADSYGASYVRIVDKRGVELVTWVSDEWKEDPEQVMGAILGAMYKGTL